MVDYNFGVVEAWALNYHLLMVRNEFVEYVLVSDLSLDVW